MFTRRGTSIARAARAFIAGGSVVSVPTVAFTADAQSNLLKPIKCDDGTSVIPWQAASRSAQLKRLETENFDVVVIGGGCVGAGVAWEASTRGLKVALVERDDFSAGTSGRSTKLIHGGIRYLESAFKNLDYSMLALVKEALEERAHLLNAAPYMAQPLATLIPIFTWWEIPYMWAGTKLYDIVAGSHRFVPSAHFISADEAKQQFPMLKADGLKGGIVYYDGRHNDTRMNLMIALTAAQEGAAIGNYIAVESILKDGDGHAKGVSVRDVETGRTFKINAKSVVNATGCFGDNIRLMDNPSTTPLILGAAGVHVILPDHFSPDRMGLIIPKTRDGRVLFLLPWEGSTIAGTTDSPCDITMDPKATADDISFIISEANNFLSRPIKRSDVKAAWSGIRPLIKDPKKLAAGGKSSQLTRSHIVETSPSGMVSILGGKWTTYRRMAQDAVDELAKSIKDLPPTGPSITQHRQLLGADRAGVVVHRRYDRIAITLRETYGFDKEVANHLVANYGTRALQVAEIAKGSSALFERISQRYPFIKAEVVFAADHEYARTITDILARRTRLGFLNADEAQQAIPIVADLMATRLGWSSSKRAAEIAAATKFLEGMR